MLYNVLYTVVVKELNIILVCTFIKLCWKVQLAVTHFTFINTIQYRKQKFENSHETWGCDRKLDLHWQWTQHNESTDTQFQTEFNFLSSHLFVINLLFPVPLLVKCTWSIKAFLLPPVETLQQHLFKLKQTLSEKRYRLFTLVIPKVQTLWMYPHIPKDTTVALTSNYVPHWCTLKLLRDL